MTNPRMSRTLKICVFLLCLALLAQETDAGFKTILAPIKQILEKGKINQGKTWTEKVIDSRKTGGQNTRDIGVGRPK